MSLILLFSGFIAISYTILVSVIGPAFGELEISAARSDLHRAEAALRADTENLDAVVADWAAWDDSYSFVGGDNPGFQKSNLDDSTLENLSLDLMGVFGTGSRLIWGVRGVGDDAVAIETVDVFNQNHELFSALTQHTNVGSGTVGIVQTNHGPLLVSSRPIVRTDGSGAIAGALVMGQFLDNSFVNSLRERTGVDIQWAVVTSQVDTGETASFDVENGFIRGEKVLVDINGQPVLQVSTQTPREISSLGSQTITAATTLLVLTGVLVCGFIWFMLRRTILRPIEQLANHIDEIRQSGDLGHQIQMRRDDEIGALADQFDVLTGEVNDARQLLLHQSFNAGKADTAAEVMHNVRNAMTPMINGVDRVRRLLSDSKKLRIKDALQQMDDANCTVERKEKFLEYTRASFRHLKTIGENIREEINIVSSQAKQIEGILTDQECYSGATPLAEILGIDELVEEASNVIPKEAHGEVELTVDGNLDQRRVRAYRIGLLQVLGNLILNAFESIKRQGNSGGTISLAAADEIVDETPMVRVTVSDNGSGFDSATKDQIFQRGFTSKQDGEFAGLGLHWCANAVAGMGGRLSAESSGEGQGAQFHVLLPAARGA